MTDRPPTPTEIQVVAALLCEEMPIEAIAGCVARSVDEVRLIVEAAEEMGLIRHRPTLTLESIDPEVDEFVRNEALTLTLTEALGDRLESMLAPIVITPSPWEMFTEFDLDTAREASTLLAYRDAEGVSARIACARAAQELGRCLFDGADHVLGLNWGYHVSETIRRVQPRPSELGPGTISIVSLFGDLGFELPASEAGSMPSRAVNCNTLVAELAQRLAGHAEAVPLNVPGFIPARFARDDATFASIRELLTSHGSYQEIFGGPAPDHPDEPRAVSGISNRPPDARIAMMDTILTGFGAADRHTVLHNFQRSLLDDEEIPTLLRLFREGRVAGDIGGFFVASPTGRDGGEVQAFLAGLNRRLLAAQLSDFVDVASRHRKRGRGGGVIGVTVGARKAQILYALLSMDPSPISRLVIDTHCALALLNLLDPAALRRYADDAGDRLTRRRDEWSRSTRALIQLV